MLRERYVSVVMPAYNEETCICENLAVVSKVLSEFLAEYEIIAVNDGSKDRTKQEIKRAMEKDSHIRCVSYERNRGKGYAIKAGVKKADGQYIAFLDSDLDLPPEQLKTYIQQFDNTEVDIVIGSKMHKDSKIEYPLVRRMISLGYYCVLKVLFHLNVKDTQTGLKIFKAEALKSVIDKITTQGFAYDIEILVALNRKGYHIKEMPVQLTFQRGNGMGRIRLKDILKVFTDTLKIFYLANVKKFYN